MTDSTTRKDHAQAYLDLEEPIRDLKDMATIADSLLIKAAARSVAAGEHEGEIVFRFTEREYSQLMFAIRHTADMAEDVWKAYC